MNISYQTIAIKNPEEVKDGSVLLYDESTGTYYAASLCSIMKNIEDMVRSELQSAAERMEKAEKAIYDKAAEMDRKYEDNLAKQKEINAKVIELASALSEGE